MPGPVRTLNTGVVSPDGSDAKSNSQSELFLILRHCRVNRPARMGATVLSALEDSASAIGSIFTNVFAPPQVSPAGTGTTSRISLNLLVLAPQRGVAAVAIQQSSIRHLMLFLLLP